MNANERTIIGELGTAGRPISAKVVEDAPAGLYKLRWRDTGTSFVLERWDDFTRDWQEVPCLVERIAASNAADKPTP